jgi:NADH-quinone oxidoreductase subunit K
MELQIYQFIILSTLLFLIGLWGIIVSRINFIIILMSIELLLFAININFVTFSIYLVDMVGIVIALFILTIAAAESAIGLAVLIVYYRVRSVVSLTSVTSLKA